MRFAIRTRGPDEAGQLFGIWRAAVLATHGFLSSADFVRIEAVVRDHYVLNADLSVAADAEGRAAGFMGMTGNKIDALFVAPPWHGCGVGRLLVEHARTLHPDLLVDVNEQNEGAGAFYERLGFRVVRRSPTDGDGRPYPLLHLRSGDGRSAPD